MPQDEYKNAYKALEKIVDLGKVKQQDIEDILQVKNLENIDSSDVADLVLDHNPNYSTSKPMPEAADKALSLSSAAGGGYLGATEAIHQIASSATGLYTATYKSVGALLSKLAPAKAAAWLGMTQDAVTIAATTTPAYQALNWMYTNCLLVASTPKILAFAGLGALAGYAAYHTIKYGTKGAYKRMSKKRAIKKALKKGGISKNPQEPNSSHSEETNHNHPKYIVDAARLRILSGLQAHLILFFLL